jgi:rRNA maturation RNase YbeY
MEIDFNQFSEVTSWNEIQSGVEKKLETALVQMALDHDDVFGWINVIVLPSEDHKNLNNRYLNHDYATDVLTFPFDDEQRVSGEVYLDATVVKENAERFAVSESDEYMRMVIHGALHLLGYNDATEEEQKEMSSKEDYYLKSI